MKMNNNTEETNKTFYKRVQTPTILQMDMAECGAVSLAILLGYYGLYLPIETMRAVCGVTRDGSKAINIIKAARNLNMKASGLIVHDLNILRTIKPPFIIWWKFEHFMVVEGLKNNKVYLNDPATGPRVMPLDEFSLNFTGVVLEITPDNDFKPGGVQERSTLELLGDYYKGNYLELSFIFLSSVLLAIPKASMALFMQFFIDNIVINGQKQWMPGYIAAMLFTLISIVALLYIQRMFIVRYKILFSIRKIPDFFYKLLQLPMSFYQQRSPADMANRMHIFDVISEKITTVISDSVFSILSIIIYLLVIFILNPVIGLLTLLITLLTLSSLSFTRRKIVDLGRRYSYDKAKVYEIEYGGVRMIEELKFMNEEHKFFSHWTGAKAKVLESQQKMDIYTALISILPSTMYFFNLVFMVILSLYFVSQGVMSVGGIMAIYTLLLLFPAPVINIVDNFLRINELKADLVRVNDVLQAYKPFKKKRQKDTIQTENLLEIQGLYFGYSTLEAPILADINISIKKGNTVAITGQSGGGKSSLLNLICGLFETWAGGIYLKGKNIKDYPPDDLFKIISYVDQNIFLFEGSIRDNLTMWDNTIDDETIFTALKAACIYDMVLLKGGLDYHISEGGTNISLGQAQRLELARALIKKPELILLDEATSALDSVTEAQIYKNLYALDCTFFIVAHRLSAIRHCHEIILVEDGSVKERGVHEELMKLKGRYYDLISKDYLS